MKTWIVCLIALAEFGVLAATGLAQPKVTEKTLEVGHANAIGFRDSIDLAGSWENLGAGPGKYGNWRVQPAMRPDLPPTNQWIAAYMPGQVFGYYFDPDDKQNPYKMKWVIWTKAWDGFFSNTCRNVWMERDADVPATWQGRRVYFAVDNVWMDALVFVNDSRIGEILNPGGEIDVSSGIKFGERNRLRLFVTGDYTGISRGAKEDRLRSVSMGDSQVPLGIGGKIVLQSCPAWGRITDVFVKPSWRQKKLFADVEIESVQSCSNVTVRGVVVDAAGKPALQLTSAPLSLPSGRIVQKLEANWIDPRLWEPGDTNLYTITVSVGHAEGKTIDEYPPVRFGFREIWVQGKEIYLNGHPFRLRMHTSGSSLQGNALFTGMGWNMLYFPPWGHFQWYDSPGAGAVATGEALGCAVNCPLGGVNRPIRKKLIEDAELRKQWNAVLERDMRRYRNSPYVLGWSVCTFLSGAGGDCLYPPGIGRRVPSQSEDAGGALAYETIKKIDPTRLVFGHDCAGYVGDIHDYFLWPNWIPLQEYEEWLSEWAKSGEAPIGTYENGMIWSGDFYRKGDGTTGCSGAWPPAHGDPVFTEYSALRLGDRAYELETDEMVRDLVKLTRNNLVRDPSESKLDPPPACAEVLAESFLRINRAWRTWGINGGMPPWWFPYGYGGKRDGDGGYRYGSLAGQGKPADYLQRPAWANRIYDVYRSCDWPLLAYIAGAGKDNFTLKDHVYAAGEHIKKSVALVWDGGKPIEARVRWEITQGGRKIDGADKIVKLKPGEIRFEPIHSVAPKTNTRQELQISCRVTAPGEEDQSDTFGVTIYPPAPKTQAAAKIGLYDPAGLTGKALKRLGVSAQTVASAKDLGSIPTLIVGSRSLKPAQPLPFSADDIARGLRVIIFEQNYDALESLGFRTAEIFARKVWSRAKLSPYLNGIESDDLRDWRGAPTLLPDRGFIRKYAEPHSYHWGNNGVVASVLIETPHLGAFTPVIEGEFDMQYSPLLEWRHGKGSVSFCQMDVTERVGTDPVATRLFLNLVNPMPQKPDVPRCAMELVCDDQCLPFFNSLQLDLNRVTKPALKPGTVLVVVGNGGAVLEGCKPELLGFVENGGIVFAVLGKEEELNKWLPVKIKCERKELARCSRSMIAEDFLSAVGPSLLRWRAMVPVDTVAAEGLPANARRLAEGCFVVLPQGKGRIILSRLDPLAFNLPETADRLERNVVRSSAWRMRRLYAQILGNLGAGNSPALAGRLTRLQGVRGIEQFEDLGGWQVLGPFDEGNDKNNGSERGPNFDKELLPETKVDLKAEVKAGNRVLRWTPIEESRVGANQQYDKPFQRPDGWVDFTAYRTAPKRPGVVSYACTTFKSPRAGSAEFRTGMDWWLKVWVNGKLAYAAMDAGGPCQKNGTLFKADVQAGTNTVLVKVAAGASGYGFWLTMLPLADNAMDAISGCSYYTEPQRMNDDPYISCGW